ncbi:MAG: hypothetical protein JJ868_19315 [Shimia sp.]|uniref:hypothetical protein n=1 Tax=Shimia sp. TaxID=1954381 RepID=UPI001B06AB65|nr:hypothetical protein [Shimia sp.]MBO6899519.1 hypothetical protein [Shimia sp.]
MTERDTTLSEYRDSPDAESVQLLVKHFARNLSDRVKRIFSDPLQVKYVTASALKRQVWNAVLAVPDEIQDIPQFRQNLLTKSNRQLLQEAYDTVPNGFRLALRKTGPFAQSRDFYSRRHQHLTEHPDDYRYLNGYAQIDEPLLDIIIKLPGTLSSFKYAKYFGSPRDVHRFVIAWELMHQNETCNSRLWTDAARQLSQYGKASSVVIKCFHAVPLPLPAIHHPYLRHISTVGDLISTGKRYQNCLNDLAGVVLNNEYQIYEWIDDADPCIVSLRADRPFGFVQGSIKAKNNQDPDFVTQVTIQRTLAELGVPDRPRVVRIVRYASQIRPYQQHKIPTPDDTDDDDIGLEELMLDENDLPF